MSSAIHDYAPLHHLHVVRSIHARDHIASLHVRCARPRRKRKQSIGTRQNGGRVVQIIYPGVGNNSQFVYDGMGDRVKIVETANNVVTKTQQYVGSEERDAGGSVVKQFFRQGENITGTHYFYSCDHLNSIREMTDSSGNVVAEYNFDLWGQATSLQGSVVSDFQFCHYYLHGPSGLNLTHTRQYSGLLGRWLSRDTVDEREGVVNAYAYVNNIPSKLTDPSGRYAIVEGDTQVKITLPIIFSLRGVSSATKDRIKKGIEYWWTSNPTFGKYCVKTTVTESRVNGHTNYVVLTDLPYEAPTKQNPDGVNWPDNSHPFDDEYGSETEEYGDWNINVFVHESGDFSWNAAHEAGHLMGLHNGEGGIMSHINALPIEQNISDIKARNKHKTQ